MLYMKTSHYETSYSNITSKKNKLFVMYTVVEGWGKHFFGKQIMEFKFESI